MADSKSFTQLPDVGEFTADDVFALSHKVNSSTWVSRKASLTAMGLALLNALQYEALETDSKKVIEAINELNKNKILHFSRTLTFTNGLANVDVSLAGYVDDETRAYPVVVMSAAEYLVVAEGVREPGHYRFPIRTMRNPTFAGSLVVDIFIAVGNVIDL